MKRKIALIALFAMLLSLCACGGSGTQPTGAPTEAPTEAPSETPTEATSEPGDAAPETRTLTDPSGAEVTLPGEINSVVVLAPAITHVLVAMGLQDKIVAYDTYSVGIDGLPENVPQFDIGAPDVEQLVALAPDLILCSGLSFYNQDDPFHPLLDAGIAIANIPSSTSIDNVKTDIRFIAAAMGAEEAGQAVLDKMNDELDEIAAIAAAIPQEERRTVYFEIGAAPYMYSFGADTFMNELVEFIGAENVLADQSGWLNVSGEDIVAKNPDVILTNVNYIDAPVDEIMGRDGWAGLTAIENGDVYYIDNDASSQPCQNITVALRQMGEAVYPDYFKAQE